MPAGSSGVAVDLPGGLWGKAESRKALHAAVHDLKQRGYQASALFGNSQTAATKRLIVSRGPYDAILIDGDHTLAGVTRDWQLYGDLAPLVAFHDIVGTGEAESVQGRPVEVPKLWDALKQTREHIELVETGSKMGIGVLCASTS